ncbi:MAG: substrate-binding domain-containing protein, partial [Alicyclobacillus sp.]|nr:substrate-binding domain-containing protein [Alicyclobacillus sp.]
AGVHGVGVDKLPEDCLRVRWARWQVGVAVAAGNPRSVTGLVDLARPDLCWVRRDPATALARLYDTASADLHVSVRWSAVVAVDHLQAAEMVATGAADAALTTAWAARQWGLAFLPVEEHTFDLWLPVQLIANPVVSRWLDLLQSPGLRRQLASWWGYDVTHLGEVSEHEVVDHA